MEHNHQHHHHQTETVKSRDMFSLSFYLERKKFKKDMKMHVRFERNNKKKTKPDSPWKKKNRKFKKQSSE